MKQFLLTRIIQTLPINLVITSSLSGSKFHKHVNDLSELKSI